ncbi:putative two-component system sensor kinase [Actinoplanes missouriensis 431]|uniref:histidine kinase n=1 Tax=Actinoplanes missouriensis (strain ATCC 14538 / DSM 43046 / CBS 188.64 / JCM 3121 / NBRC 102363 / NCIMB 12654 / NRRL B-3342 / UNCC 431) TaxID=512565 RepID=I0HFR0_ACTM4|nr:histidine kinase [Actinoplanes missouriensis]BAL91847.1 putative two-component system sensor kinase [Actinoplanes missouriensis 431]
MLTKNFTYVAAALTLVGVPAGIAVTGGDMHLSGDVNLSGDVTRGGGLENAIFAGTLACWLALFALGLRRWPRGILILSLCGVFAMRGALLVHSGAVWPVTAALVAVVLAGHLRFAAVTGSVAVVWFALWDATAGQRSADWVLGSLGGEALWLAAVLAGVTAYRNSVRWRHEVAHRIAQDESQREIDARRRRAEERVEIARDLHDVVSHTLAVVGVHLNVALDAFDAEPEEARASMKLAQEVRNRAMTDLKSLVGVLREGEVPALESLEGLADQVRAAGLKVSVTEFGDPADVPAPVATAVYRVVQESLTNTVRHAGATRVVVTLRYSPTRVVVDVQDDGSGGDGSIVDGHGIAGMRERVAALGGALTAGPGKTGFTVRAGIPILAD